MSGEFCESLKSPSLTNPTILSKDDGGEVTITYSESIFGSIIILRRRYDPFINLQSSSESSNFQGFPLNEKQLSRIKHIEFNI